MKYMAVLRSAARRQPVWWKSRLLRCSELLGEVELSTFRYFVIHRCHHNYRYIFTIFRFLVFTIIAFSSAVFLYIS